MNFFTRALPVPTIAVLTAVAACGSQGSAPTAGNGGNAGSGGPGSGSGAGGTGSAEGGAASSSSGGSATSSSGGGANGGGNTFGSFGDAGTPAGDLTGQQCLGLNTTRTCCTTGTQTCSSAAEFAVWGPCLSAAGATVVCGGTGDAGCGMNETGKACDAGVDAPPPPPPPTLEPPPPICKDMAISTEPEILVGYSPALGQTVSKTGQIKVWVNDENPPFVAPGEQIDPKTGLITAPGNRIASALDGLLWEPALYIAPDTPQNGGRPHFPQWVKGWYDNTPPNGSGGHQVPGMDPVPGAARLAEIYTGEDIWDVAALGLAPGQYTAVFVIHDGDDDRAIGCVTIGITP